MTNLTLYHHGPSTCSQKVRLILELKNLSYESKEIDLLAGEQHAPEYVKLNPNHVVPTLVTGDSVLIESNLILEYLDDAFPDIPARPSAPEAVHKVRLWMKHIDVFQQFTGPITYGIAVRRVQMGKSDEEKEAALMSIPDPVKRQARKETMENGIKAQIVISSLKKAGEFLDRMEENIEDSGWIVGDKFGLADACTLPYIQRFDHLALSDAFSETKRPKINNWYKKVKDLDFFDKAITSHLQPPLVEMMGKFGEEVKDEALKIMEER
tara:strand:- start:118 stop:918 length:801 start_codon:yes stop_codon:yes gene_type:complete